MNRRTRIWLVIATAFTALNLGAAVYAALPGEVMHALIHVGLSAAGLGWIWWLGSRARAAGAGAIADEQLRELQNSVDAIAVEVERIGEAQRFTAKQVAEQRHDAPPGRRDT